MYSADLLIDLSFPLVGNPSDSTLAKESWCCIKEKDSGQAGMTDLKIVLKLEDI
jgi:hypothetical protein